MRSSMALARSDISWAVCGRPCSSTVWKSEVRSAWNAAKSFASTARASLAYWISSASRTGLDLSRTTTSSSLTLTLTGVSSPGVVVGARKARTTDRAIVRWILMVVIDTPPDAPALRLLAEIRLGRGTADPVDVPRGVDGDQHQRIVRRPRLVVHLRGNVVETTRSELLAHALVLERPVAADDRVGFVGAVPVHRDVHLFRHANHQVRGLGGRIDAQDRDLRGVGAQL